MLNERSEVVMEGGPTGGFAAGGTGAYSSHLVVVGCVLTGQGEEQSKKERVKWAASRSPKDGRVRFVCRVEA